MKWIKDGSKNAYSLDIFLLYHTMRLDHFNEV